MPHPEHTIVSLPSKQQTDHMHVMSTQRQRVEYVNSKQISCNISGIYLQCKQ